MKELLNIACVCLDGVENCVDSYSFKLRIEQIVLALLRALLHSKNKQPTQTSSVKVLLTQVHRQHIKTPKTTDTLVRAIQKPPKELSDLEREFMLSAATELYEFCLLHTHRTITLVNLKETL